VVVRHSGGLNRKSHSRDCFDLLRVLPEVNAVHDGGVACGERGAYIHSSPRSGVGDGIKWTTQLQSEIREKVRTKRHYETKNCLVIVRWDGNAI
jgi:hypothetical protein